MALHIHAGELPAFYWGQPYLGSLEAYLVAAAFWLVGPSNLVLKIVPGLVYLGFAVLLFLGARRDYGEGVALLSLAYLALPPSFLALWSIKARGGYVELLALGQALTVLTAWVTEQRSRRLWKFGLLGLLSGLLLWTHVLGMIYVVPSAVYMALRLRRAILGLPLLAWVTCLVIGAMPALVYNLQHDWETLTALSTTGTTLEAFQENLRALLRIGLPVMVGLGQATSSPLLFAESWRQWPASWPWVAPLLLAILVIAILPSLQALVAPARRCIPGRVEGRQADNPNPTAFFGLAVLGLTPPLISLGRFGELVAEPRYALPLYAAVPLFAAAVRYGVGWAPLTTRPPHNRDGGHNPPYPAPIPALVVGCVFAINAWSLMSADPRLNLPTTAAGSNQANRRELIGYLESRGLTEVYADYWLAYPLMFESQEHILASVTSGGYDRLGSYAYFVAVSQRPAFVFVSGSAEQSAFDSKLAAIGGRAVRERVSIYELYSGVEPLDQMRP